MFEKQKKFLTLDLWLNLLARFLAWFVKRNPVGLINKTFNQRHPYWSAAIAAVTIVSLVLSTVWFGFFRSGQKAEAAWWNDSWSYRKAIFISNETDAEQTNYQVKILYDTDLSAEVSAGKIRADLGDLRFTDISGNVLPYWIETPLDSSSVDAWVKMPLVPKGPISNSAAVYMYYGNPSASSAANGDDVFELFDDFNDGVIDPDKWAMAAYGSGGSYTEADGQLQLTASNNQTGSAVAKSLATFTNDFAIEWRRYDTEEHYNDFGIGYGAVLGGSGTDWWHTVPENGYVDIIQDNVTFNMVYYPGGSGLDVDNDGPDAGQWVQYYNSYNNNGSWGWYWKDSPNSLRGIGSASNSDFVNNDKYLLFSRGGVSSQAWGGTSKLDWVFVHKATMEAVFPGGSGSEEKGSGPIAYWSFDEGQGTLAHDGTVNNSDGTLTLMSATPSPTSGWQTEDNCVSGKCLAFDGNNDYAVTVDKQFIGHTNHAHSVFAWVKPTSAGVSQTIWNYGESHDNNYASALAILPNGHLAWSVNGYDTGSYSIDSGLTVPTNVWSFVGFSHEDSGSNVSLFVNGQVYSGSYGLGGTVGLSQFLIGVGSVNSGLGGYFTGSIDEVKVYNYTRSTAQVKMDYNVGLAGMSGASAGDGAAVAIGKKSSAWMSNGLVGYWKMDEAVGTWDDDDGFEDVVDWSGNGNTGDAVGNASTTAGKFGNGGIFDGTGDYVITPTITINNGFSTAFWLKTTTGTTNARAFAWGWSKYCLLNWSMGAPWTNKIVCVDGAETWVTSSVDVNDGAWHYIEWTNNGTSQSLYVDGLLQESRGSTSASDSTYMTIGANMDGTSNFAGSLDDFRFYNRALSAKEVSDLYNWAPGPVGYWKMDERQGQAVNDSSGNSNNGTLGADANVSTDDPTWTNGKYGSGLKFEGVYNGQSDKVQIGSDLLGTGTITFSAWINAQNVTEDGYIVSNSVSRTFLEIQPQMDRILFSSNQGNNLLYIGHIPFDFNQWVYLTVVRLSDGTATMYANGAVIGGPSSSGTPMAGATNTLIGGYDINSFNGSIDDVKIYNYARTQKQIIQDMNASAPAAVAKAVSATGKGTVGYWKFDEGYGTKANDSSGQGNNGTLTGPTHLPTWSNNGKFGKAISFDGVDDYVTVPDNPAFTFGTSSFSVAMWVKPLAGNNLINKFGDEGGGWLLGIYSDYFLGNFFDGNSGINVTSDNPVVLGSWYRVVLEADREHNLARLFINGVLQTVNAEVSIANLNIFDNDGNITIGNYLGGGDPITGLIDEVKIYPYALTADEVKLDYNQGAAIQLGSFSQSSTGVASSSAASIYCVPGSTDACSPPVGEWTFNEGKGQYAQDTSGNGNTGTLGTGATADASDPTWVAGKVSNALKFDGGDYAIKESPSNVLDLTSAGTISAWIKSNGPLDFSAIVNRSVFTSSFNGFSLWERGAGINKVQLSIGDTGAFNTISADTTIVNGNWYYVVGTWDGSFLKIYVNGKSDATPVAQTVNATPSGRDLYIGTATPGNYYWNGSIDQVRVYNYARTPAQVAWEYNKGAPVGYWMMDECQGGTAHDSSGNGNNGLIYPGTGGTQTATGTCAVAGTMWGAGASGKRNASLNFDGTDDYVDVAKTFDFTNELTMCAWAYPRSYQTNGNSPDWAQRNIVDSYNSGISEGDDQLHGLSINGTSNGLWHGVINWDGTVPAGNRASVDGNVAQLNTWTHVCMTADGSSLKIYENGRYVNSTNYTNIGLYDPTDFKIGKFAKTINEGYFDGQIDDVQIYNYALTATQVKNLYTGGTVRFGN